MLFDTLHLVQGLSKDFFTSHLKDLVELKTAAAREHHGVIDRMITTIEYGKDAHQIRQLPDVLSENLSDADLLSLTQRQASPIILSGPTTCSWPQQRVAGTA